jgi:hypothetical protein
MLFTHCRAAFGTGQKTRLRWSSCRHFFQLDLGRRHVLEARCNCERVQLQDKLTKISSRRNGGVS